MALIPGIDCLGLGFERTLREHGVVDCSADDSGQSGLSHGIGILVRRERNDREPLPNVPDEEQRLIAADPMLAGHSGQGGVYFREAVSAAATGSLIESSEQTEARALVNVFAVEDRHEYRGIEKPLHLR